MSIERDEAKRLRIREAVSNDEFSQAGRDPSLGMPCLLARTTMIKIYPATAQSFFACSPLTILGAEVEGGAGSLNAGNSTFLALNIGTAIPTLGTNVLATFVESRWVFRFDG